MLCSKKVLKWKSGYKKILTGKSLHNNPIVTVKEGQLQGSSKSLLDGAPYFSFKGIPYGAAAVGKHRFKASSPVKPWLGIWDASHHGPVCPQYDIYTSSIIEGHEDCLTLNIYTKSLEPSAKLPVMIYIHGGAYMSGSGNSSYYGPHFLIQHDVILVTINYRLETLGFLNLDLPEVSGNAGLKDQVLALKWVKDNVRQFGGDPDNVTLFGESAGAACVTLHMLSPMSKGLFHKAIAQSGICTQDWALGFNSVDRAFRIGQMLGKNTKSKNELLEFLQSIPAIDTTKMSIKSRTPTEIYRGLPIHLAPVVEKKFDNVDRFLSDSPIELLCSKKVNMVPFLAGYTSGDGMIGLPDQIKKAEVLNKNPGFLVPREIVDRIGEENARNVGEKLKNFYFNGNMTGTDPNAIVNMVTDRHFSYHAHRFAHICSLLDIPSYLYVFDYETDLNITKKLGGFSELRGVCHVDDLFYIFSSDFTKDVVKQQAELRDAIYRVTKLWTDFAKTGNPTPDGLWKPFTVSNQEYLHIKHEFIPSSHAYRERIEFWDNLYKDAGLPHMESVLQV